MHLCMEERDWRCFYKSFERLSGWNLSPACSWTKQECLRIDLFYDFFLAEDESSCLERVVAVDVSEAFLSFVFLSRDRSEVVGAWFAFAFTHTRSHQRNSSWNHLEGWTSTTHICGDYP